MVLKDPDHFSHKSIQQKDVIAFTKNPEDWDAWKIIIPNTLAKNVMEWYHVKLGHAGIERLVATVGARFHISNLRARAEEAIHNCPARCQQFKPIGKGYGHLPPKIARGSPWDEIAVDLVGPWKIELNTRAKKKTYEILALTVIDTFTNLPEIIRINGKTSKHVAEQFANVWLA